MSANSQEQNLAMRRQYAERDSQWKRLTLEAKILVALEGYRRRCNYRANSKLIWPWKPYVRVFRVSTRKLLVIRVANHFVSSYTWDRLMYKLALNQWQKLNQTLLKRWK